MAEVLTDSVNEQIAICSNIHSGANPKPINDRKCNQDSRQNDLVQESSADKDEITE
jgi:hypothetical protein